MNNSINKILSTILLISFLIIVGCPNNDVPNIVNCDGQSLELLTGSYSLSSFKVAYDNGNIVTEQDYYAYSGSMEIGSDCKLSQTIILEGERKRGTGIIFVKSDNELEVFSQGCIYNLNYSLNSNNLTTIRQQGSCNIDYSEINVWKKISSKPDVIKSIFDEIEDDYEINEAIVGGVAGSIE